MSDNIRARIMRLLSDGVSMTKNEMATVLETKPATVGYHLTKLRKRGSVDITGGKWKRTKTKKEPENKRLKVVEPEPVVEPAPEPETTPLILKLIVARAALDDAIEELERLESAVFGGK